MKYIVNVREVWVQPVLVEADTEAEAIQKVQDGADRAFCCFMHGSWHMEELFEYSHTLGTETWIVEIYDLRKHGNK